MVRRPGPRDKKTHRSDAAAASRMARAALRSERHGLLRAVRPCAHNIWSDAMNRRKIDWAIVVLAIALLIGAYFRFWDLTNRSLFLDEAFTLWVAAKPWAAMMNQIVYHDFHPPVFYALTHWLVAALRWQPWDYRFLTAPFGLLTIVASWAIARRLFGD